MGNFVRFKIQFSDTAPLKIVQTFKMHSDWPKPRIHGDTSKSKNLIRGWHYLMKIYLIVSKSFDLEHHFIQTSPCFFYSKEEKQSDPPASQSAGAHLCSWAISWLRSSSSLMPVNSADPVELVLSWGERQRQTGESRERGGSKRVRWNVEVRVTQGESRDDKSDNAGVGRGWNRCEEGMWGEMFK